MGFSGGSRALAGLGHEGGVDLVRIGRLRQIVEGPHLHRRHRGRDVAVAGENHAAGVRAGAPSGARSRRGRCRRRAACRSPRRPAPRSRSPRCRPPRSRPRGPDSRGLPWRGRDGSRTGRSSSTIKRLLSARSRTPRARRPSEHLLASRDAPFRRRARTGRKPYIGMVCPIRRGRPAGPPAARLPHPVQTRGAAKRSARWRRSPAGRRSSGTIAPERSIRVLAMNRPRPRSSAPSRCPPFSAALRVVT